MQPSENFSFVRRVSQIGTLLQTFLCGKEVGRDAFDNRYYEERRASAQARRRRWVIYKGEPEPTKIPPEWHLWLHYTAEAPLPDSVRKSWQKPHNMNLTGTDQACLPPSLTTSLRPKATGDYQAWKPE